MGKLGLLVVSVAGVAGFILLASSSSSAAPVPMPPPGVLPGKSVTVTAGNMGTINSGGQQVNLLLPPGSQWTGGLSGGAALQYAPGSGAFTFLWTDPNGVTQTTQVNIQ